MRRTPSHVLFVSVLTAGACALCPAQTSSGGGFFNDAPSTPDFPLNDLVVSIDSGEAAHSGATSGEEVTFGYLAHVPDATWLRLWFDIVELSGDPANDNASRIRVTSLHDGGVQVLNAEHIQQWNQSTAFFNGDTVLVEILSYPGARDRVRISRIWAGQGGASVRSICGAADDRVLSTDNRNARHSPIGCSAWVINDLNSMFLSAGHCMTDGNDVMQFNVPLSDGNGNVINPPPQDQYSVHAASVQQLNGGMGSDWAYYGVNINANTGLTPYQAYGVRYPLAAAAPNNQTDTIRITGYGTTSPPIPNQWSQVQKTHTGPYRGLSGTRVRYHVDTTGGNSGSCVFDETLGLAIGVHSHAGCDSTSGSYNNGTAIQHAGLQTALGNPLGVCATGRGTVTGNLFAFGDAANNFGTCNAATGQFAKINEIAANIQGLTADWNTGVLYAITTQRALYAVNPANGTRASLGTVTGTTLTLNGLAYDPRTGVLYAYAGSSGQLFTINPLSLVATKVGPTRGGNIGAIEWDTTSNALYGLNDSSGTRLVRISTADGALTTIGSLGGGITDCNGLAYRADDDRFYTIDASTEQLLRVSRSTGAATVVGSTGGLFGAAYGMAALNVKPDCPPDFNDDGFLNGSDYDDYVAAFDAGLPSADYNSDGFVSGDDFDEFVEDFSAGC